MQGRSSKAISGHQVAILVQHELGEARRCGEHLHARQVISGHQRTWCSASSAKHASVGSPACAATPAEGAWLGMKRTRLSEAQKLEIEIDAEGERSAAPVARAVSSLPPSLPSSSSSAVEVSAPK